VDNFTKGKLMVERTLAIIKPDAVQAGNIGNIIAKIEQSGFAIKAMKLMSLSAEQIGEFYAVHKGKPFYDGLVTFMARSAIVVLVLEQRRAIALWREVMGPTDSTQAQEGTIRSLFGTDIKHNAVHGSDSAETAQQEINFFFSPREIID
jgi:nucleoside-diphosphate kinase